MCVARATPLRFKPMRNGGKIMKRNVEHVIKAGLAASLLGACYGNACTVDVMRDVASGLEDVADDIDDSDRDMDFGDYLADLVEDW